jgi:hypothetical protein
MFFKVVGRITARFFAGIGKTFFNISRWMGKHPWGAAFWAVVLVGIVVMLYFTDVLGLTTGNFLGMGSSSAIATPTEQKTSPDGQSNDFLNALADAKAGDMYNLLSDDYKNLLKQRSIGDSNAMQTRMNDKLEQMTEQKNGRLKYKFAYQGGLRYSDGSSADQFGANVDYNGTRTTQQYIMKIANGKITDVQTDDPVLIAALGGDRAGGTSSVQLGSYSRNSSTIAEKFLAGLTVFDVDKVWDSLADSYKEQLKANNITKDSMGQIFAQIKAQNAQAQSKGAKSGGGVIKYAGFVFQQSVTFPNGTSLNSFESVVTVGDNVAQIGYNIFLDSSGKITGWGNFNGQDPILSELFGRNQQ